MGETVLRHRSSTGASGTLRSSGTSCGSSCCWVCRSCIAAGESLVPAATSRRSRAVSTEAARLYFRRRFIFFPGSATTGCRPCIDAFSYGVASLRSGVSCPQESCFFVEWHLFMLALSGPHRGTSAPSTQREMPLATTPATSGPRALPFALCSSLFGLWRLRRSRCAPCPGTAQQQLHQSWFQHSYPQLWILQNRGWFAVLLMRCF